LDPDVPAGPPEGKDLDFTEATTGHNDKVVKLIYKMIRIHPTTQLNPTMSAVAVNLFDTNDTYGLIGAGDISALKSPGKILKFEPRLALPDTNFISDVIGRRFLTALGGTREEQFENLRELKSGLGALRLTEVGDELSHLYKCIDVAIEGQIGCVPFFSGEYYEGCVLGGGYGVEISIGEHTSRFQDLVDLKNEFLVSSSHGQSLRFIAIKFPEQQREKVLAVTSMKELRDVCLPQSFTSDDRDYIIQKAAYLRFSQTTWALSPAMIKRSLALLADLPGKLDTSCPISRLCLFSKDPVMVALSVFGEKSAPSWNIPNGALYKATAATPPTIPASIKQGSGSKGTVNDSGWVMEIRRTDLISATEDFRLMASQQGYKAIPSLQARKQGYQVYSRERMAEFWMELRSAYRQVDPKLPFDDLEALLKRSSSGTVEGESAGVAAAPKAKKLKF
jgi:hypothetical protein